MATGMDLPPKDHVAITVAELAKLFEKTKLVGLLDGTVSLTWDEHRAWVSEGCPEISAWFAGRGIRIETRRRGNPEYDFEEEEPSPKLKAARRG